MPLTNFFDRLAAVIAGKKPAGAAALDRLLGEARQHLKTCETALTALEASRPETVVSGEAARLKLRRAIAEATADLEDARSAVVEIERRLADQQAVEAEQRRQAAYADALALRTEAGKRLLAEYPPAAKIIAELIASIAKADAACEAVNRSLPEGAEPLDTTERVTRTGGGAPERLLSSKEVRLWARPGASEPLSEEMQAQVRVDAQSATGGYLRSGGSIGPVMPVELRTFRRTEVLDVVPGTLPPALASISLPALRGGDPDIWIASKFWTSPAAIMVAAESSAEASRRKAEAPERRKIVIFELIADHETAASKTIVDEVAA